MYTRIDVGSLKRQLKKSWKQLLNLGFFLLNIIGVKVPKCYYILVTNWPQVLSVELVLVLLSRYDFPVDTIFNCYSFLLSIFGFILYYADICFLQDVLLLNLLKYVHILWRRLLIIFHSPLSHIGNPLFFLNVFDDLLNLLF